MTRFEEAYGSIKRRMASAYGVELKVGDVVSPNTGDFNGEQVTVDYDQDSDSALFVAAHLFGHTVQWSVSERWREVGRDVSIGRGEAALALSGEYEQEATRYGIQLLHEAGVLDLDQWISDWWHADWKYLSHYYRTGHKLDLKALWASNAIAPLAPAPIPRFALQRWEPRWSF